jgi:hypothetical protein
MVETSVVLRTATVVAESQPDATEQVEDPQGFQR